MMKSLFCVVFVVASVVAKPIDDDVNVNAGAKAVVKNINANELKAALDDPKIEVGVFDYRSAYARETQGEVKASYPIQENQLHALATLDL